MKDFKLSRAFFFVLILAMSMSFLVPSAFSDDLTKCVSGSMTIEALQSEFPGKTITDRGETRDGKHAFEISGLSESDVSRLDSVEGVEKVSHHGEVTPGKIEVMLAYAQFISRYDGSRPKKMKKGRLECKPDCGTYPGIEVTDCADLKKAKEEAAKREKEAGDLATLLSTVLDAYNNASWWSDFFGMFTDMFAAATSVLSGGTATGAAKAAAKIIKDMGKDAAINAVVGAVAGELGVDLSVDGALEDAWDKAGKAQKKASGEFQDAKKAYADCLVQQEQDIENLEEADAAWDECWKERKCEWVFE